MSRAPLLLAAAALACVEPLPSLSDLEPGPIAPGDTRAFELRYLELNVTDFEHRLDIDALRALPRSTLDGVWLMDLDVSAFVTHALTALRDDDDLGAGATAGAYNMQRLLRMTPNDIDFSRTALEPLLALSAAIGVAPAKAVADILQVRRDEPVIPLEIAAERLLIGLLASHPAGATRPSPDGPVPVAPGALPVTLGDVVDNFRGLSERFGAATLPDGTRHPGFIEHAEGFAVVEDAFQMIVRANANALPFKGVDLGAGTRASVNSLGAQIEHLFPVEVPDWIRVEGLVPQPYIKEVGVRVVEHEGWVPGGHDRQPPPRGSSPVWSLPPWTLERIVTEITFADAGRLEDHCTAYTIGAGTVAFRACVDTSGWLTFETFSDVGTPPAPSYLWDMELEMAQVRLHDGGLAEGEANVAFTLRDAPLGITADQMLERIRANLSANPVALRDLAEAINENTRGEADFFYVRADQGDWLFFVTPGDIPATASGAARPYGYPRPGFFADPALERPAPGLVTDADGTHLKVRVRTGDRLFLRDDAGDLFQLDVGEKPSPRRMRLAITRLPT